MFCLHRLSNVGKLCMKHAPHAPQTLGGVQKKGTVEKAHIRMYGKMVPNLAWHHSTMEEKYGRLERAFMYACILCSADG